MPELPVHAFPWSHGCTALLTKAYILFALPALLTIVLSLLVADRRHSARIVGTTCAALALVVAICGWWYLRIFTITGALSGEQQAAALHDVPVAEILKAIPKVAWNRAIDYACVSHIWVGNWSFLQVRSWMYHVFMYVALVAAVGITILTWRLGLRREMRRRLGVLCVYYGFFWLGVCYHVTITFVASGASVGAGWYLHAVIVSEMLLVYLGLTALTPLWLRNFIVPTMCGALLLLDLYATHCILIPYYTGLIAHKVSGALETFQFGRIDAVGISTVLNHLQANRPAFLTPFLIGIIWALFIMLSVGLFIATLWLESKSAASYLRYDNRSEQCQA